ncbi:MAG: hypothetical protein K8R77_12235 [Anaerolineaceae bacterium]|nr:hypothetical protein [Anaerolineaceae bacterium]
MQRTIISPESLGIVRAQVLEFFEKQSYKLTSLDPNTLTFERSSTPSATAQVLLSTVEQQTKLRLNWHLTEKDPKNSTDEKSIERELEGLLAAIQGEVNENEPPTDFFEKPTVDVQIVNAILRTEALFRSGADWFFWIAGLSVVNSILFRVRDGNLNFMFGLGFTQIVDAVGAMIVDQALYHNANVVYGLSMVLVLLISGLFAALGILARKRKKWAFIVGITLYLIDGAILLLAEDYISAAFHVYVLISLFRGYKALKNLLHLEQLPDERS